MKEALFLCALRACGVRLSFTPQAPQTLSKTLLSQQCELFISQRYHRVSLCGAQGRNQAGEQRR